MKKLISLALALMLVFSLATVAFASTDDEVIPPADTPAQANNGTTLTKQYTVNNGKAPAERFTFSFTNPRYVDVNGEEDSTVTCPTIGNLSIDSTQIDATTSQQIVNLTGNISISPSDFELGTYTYDVKEVAPATKTLGVTYSGVTMQLKLQILRNENNTKYYNATLHNGNVKADSFKNSYDSGSLKITKLITGTGADMNHKFDFTVTFAAPKGFAINSAISYDKTQGVEKNGNTYTFELGAGDNITFSNLPAGTIYTVTEDKEDYDQTIVYSNKGETKSITSGVTDTAEFTNNRNVTIDTGITLDTLPFVLILAVCAGAVVLFVIKRRNSAEF